MKGKKKSLVGWTSFEPKDMEYHTWASGLHQVVIPNIEIGEKLKEYHPSVKRIKVRITIEQLD